MPIYNRKTAPIPGSHLSTGYWGSPWRRIHLEQTAPKIKAWLQSKILARGRRVYLYQPVSATTPGIVPCTCTKNTNDTADRGCVTCFGTQFAPAFLKQFHFTQFWCSSEEQNFTTLTNIIVDTSKKVNRLSLSPTSLTGTVITQDKTFTQNVAAPQDYQVMMNAYERAANQPLTVSYSIDGGSTWVLLPLSETLPGQGYSGTIFGSALPTAGNIRMQIVMERMNLTDPSPQFEIIRMRRVVNENTSNNIRIMRPDFVPGELLALFPWTQSRVSINAGRGRIEEDLAERSWCMPLDYYDLSLTPDTPSCRITEATTGPHPFVVYSSGVQAQTIFVLDQISFSEQLGIFTHQLFDVRKTSGGENYDKVW